MDVSAFLVHALKSDMLRFLCISGLGQGVEGRGREDPLGAEHRASPELGGSPKSFQLTTMEVESRWGDCLLSPHPFFAWQIFRTQPPWPCKCRAVKDWGKERRELKLGRLISCLWHLKASLGPKSGCQLSPICVTCLLAGSLSLTQSWALIILSSPWLKTTTLLVTSPNPLGQPLPFPRATRAPQSILSPWKPLTVSL